MVNYNIEIQAQKAALERAKEARSKAEATKEQLLKQQEQLESECRGLGVEPEQIEKEIVRLEESIQGNCHMIDRLIPERFPSAGGFKKEVL